ALQGAQPVGTFQSADGYSTVRFPKAVEQDRDTDSDLETHLARASLKAKRLASSLGHTRCGAKREPAAVEGLRHESIGEPGIVSAEQEREVPLMDGAKVRFAHMC